MSRDPRDPPRTPLDLGVGLREGGAGGASPLERLPDRRYHRIGAVARALGVTPSVLRFWESAFSQLQPRKGTGGQRLYTREDVELAWSIQRMIHQEGYTHEGVRRRLAGEGEPDAAGPGARLLRLREEIAALVSLLDEETEGRD